MRAFFPVISLDYGTKIRAEGKKNPNKKKKPKQFGNPAGCQAEKVQAEEKKANELNIMYSVFMIASVFTFCLPKTL